MICAATDFTKEAPFQCKNGHELCATCVARIVFDDGPCECCLGFKWTCPVCKKAYTLEREHIIDLIHAGIPRKRLQRRRE